MLPLKDTENVSILMKGDQKRTTFRVRVPYLEDLENFSDEYTSKEWRDGGWFEMELTGGDKKLLSKSYVNYLDKEGALDIFLSMVYYDEQQTISREALKKHIMNSDMNYWILYNAIKNAAYENSKAK